MQVQKRRIFLVDDDTEMRLAVGRLLKASGFQVKTFESAEALLDSGMVTDADCLVLDVHMDGLSGFELCDRLRQQGHELPVIFLTAYDDPGSRERAKTLGAAAYLSKPFRARLLLEAIDVACKQRSPMASGNENKKE